MARATVGMVQEVMEPGGDWNGTTSLAPFIRIAGRVVDRVVTCAAAKGLTLTTGEAADMEALLAAHCYCMSDQTYATKSTDRASATFHGQTGLNLDGTKYGQMAQMVDYSGCLAAIGKRQFARGVWLGKTLTEQLDYEDRN